MDAPLSRSISGLQICVAIVVCTLNTNILCVAEIFHSLMGALLVRALIMLEPSEDDKTEGEVGGGGQNS